MQTAVELPEIRWTEACSRQRVAEQTSRPAHDSMLERPVPHHSQRHLESAQLCCPGRSAENLLLVSPGSSHAVLCTLRLPSFSLAKTAANARPSKGRTDALIPSRPNSAPHAQRQSKILASPSPEGDLSHPSACFKLFTRPAQLDTVVPLPNQWLDR